MEPLTDEMKEKMIESINKKIKEQRKILRDLPNLNQKKPAVSQQNDEIIRCPKCNKIRKKGGRFCSNCGFEFK